MNVHRIKIQSLSLRLALVGVALALVALFPLQVYARSVAEMQAEINRKQEQADAASRQSGYLHEKAGTEEEKIEELQYQIAGIQVKIDANITRQNTLADRIKAAQGRLQEQQALLSANILSMYIEGDISPLEMLASSKNLGDFVDKQEYRDRIKESIVNTLDEIEKLKKQLDEQRKEVTAIIDQQKGLRGKLAAKEGEAQTKLADINQSKSEFDAQVVARKQDIAKLRDEIAAAQAAVSQVNTNSLPSIGSVSKGQVIGTVGNTGYSFGAHLHLRAQWSNGIAVNPFNYLGNRWSHPLNAPITQGFGTDEYGLYGGAGHDGIDYGAPAGTPIKAVESGILVKRSWVGAFGCMAMIRHHDGLVSIYAHMEARNC